MSRGIFITLEGPDGSGKSTQLAYLRELLESMGLDVVCTREPGGTHIGEKIRDIILDAKHMEMAPITEAMLYASSRAQHVAEVIRPALFAGRVVLCDRYVDSSIAYQGYGRGLGEVVTDINALAVGDAAPDLTILIDIPPADCFERIGHGGDRIESEALAYHQSVYDGYLRIASADPARVKLVNGARDRESVRGDIAKLVEDFMAGRRGS
jgi:dTMP kinase